MGLVKAWHVPALAAAALILVVSGIAAALLARNALANGGENTLLACVGERSGAVRLVDHGDECLRGEELVSWNVEGPAGEPGGQGPKGPQGAQGARGPQGATGAKGDTGAQGQQGEQGPQGEPGAPGATNYDIAVFPIATLLGANEQLQLVFTCTRRGPLDRRVISIAADLPPEITFQPSTFTPEGSSVFAKFLNTSDETVFLNGDQHSVSLVCAAISFVE